MLISMKQYTDVLFNLSKHLEMLDGTYDNILLSKDYKEAADNLKKAYKVIKDIGSSYYIGGYIVREYTSLLNILTYCENILSDYYICDTTALFGCKESFVKEQNINSETKRENILDSIVALGRLNIYDRLGGDYKDISFQTLDVTNECFDSSEDINEICESYGIKSKKIKITPGYTTKVDLLNKHGFHYFNIVEIDGFSYLVDITYKQFFQLRKNLIERLGILNIGRCHPGVYMMMDEKRSNVAKELLYRGWILATPENVKAYLDGFTLSFRNGLYYENHPETRYVSPYSIEDYIRFFTTDESMLDYEDRDELGWQLKPLKDSRFKF